MSTTTKSKNRLAGADIGTNGSDHVSLTVTPPRIEVIEFRIRGITPLVQLRFSEKARNAMMTKMAEGASAKSKKDRKARDFDEDYRQAIHRSEEGWAGVPASAFRCAMISACRLVNFKMTIAKMSVFILGDGIDALDKIPLVQIEGEHQRLDSPCRNATGVMDIRIRACWPEWSAKVRVQYDQDQFKRADVVNLMARAGLQVGIGEGRPDSRMSAGMGWGQFTIEGE